MFRIDRADFEAIVPRLQRRKVDIGRTRRRPLIAQPDQAVLVLGARGAIVAVRGQPRLEPGVALPGGARRAGTVEPLAAESRARDRDVERTRLPGDPALDFEEVTAPLGVVIHIERRRRATGRSGRCRSTAGHR